ncbi:glycosyltransferase family 2 protein [Aeromonas hydrophila]|uniref:glycosyltransferase family 2 protein n=1 Tax=Aeromonas hydrophila TaxID=644 RepID=UPI001C5B0FF5|nr:glycosyltransferase [Aeromonas hydrophila]MBW3833723.1 glycosyltransferase [Aeromonas hydrophila]MBW5265790.1 glycosyltransferase [Aeromonas hydrophila]MBW5279143.1 glycosyltransferase [Aeromonas hydrophila]
MNFSVVITTKDRLAFLKRAVMSISVAGGRLTEIIIVNDGGERIENYFFSDYNTAKINVINNPTSLGGNKARNQGVLAASGDIIFFLDDDDAYTADTISEKLRLFESDTQLALVYTGVQFVMSDNLDMVVRTKQPIADNELLLKHLLARGNLIGPTSCAAVRKSAFIAAGMFDEKLGAMQDYELWLRMIQHGKVMSDGGLNLIYTIHSSGAQISSKYEKYLVAANYISDKFKNELDKFDVSRCFWAEVYFRVALSCSHASELLKVRFAIKSFVCKPALKSMALLMPTSLLKRIKPFV